MTELEPERIFLCTLCGLHEHYGGEPPVQRWTQPCSTFEIAILACRRCARDLAELNAAGELYLTSLQIMRDAIAAGANPIVAVRAHKREIDELVGGRKERHLAVVRDR